MKIKIILAWLSLTLISGCAASSTRCQIEGYLGPMEIEVRSQNQRITELRVLSHEDTAEIADPAFAEFIAQVQMCIRDRIPTAPHSGVWRCRL